mmetsp:Transcript_11164/g.24984  ORF Transcript_11164/g.24984 Transcript_11164/m.24984 type:complete len:386 (-) Transcript_11164:71-1228(-)
MQVRLALLHVAAVTVGFLQCAADAAPLPIYLKHGLDWTEGSCLSRELQSPVNFDSQLTEPPGSLLDYHYEPIGNVTLKLAARAGTLSVDLSQKLWGGVSYDDAWFPLTRIDFRGPAEHLIKGARSPLEVQLVHQQESDPARLLIISSLISCKEPPQAGVAAVTEDYVQPVLQVNSEKFLQHFLAVRPPAAEGQSTDVVLEGDFIDLRAFLEASSGRSSSFIKYAGSLTAPPCIERTTWLVRQTRRVASNAQVKAFADSIYALTDNKGNFREVMPMNHRVLSVVGLRWLSMADMNNRPTLPRGPNPRTDDELNANRLVRQVLPKTKQVLDQTMDLAKRLQRAETAADAEWDGVAARLAAKSLAADQAATAYGDVRPPVALTSSMIA